MIEVLRGGREFRVVHVPKPHIMWRHGFPWVWMCGDDLLDRKAMAWCATYRPGNARLS